MIKNIITIVSLFFILAFSGISYAHPDRIDRVTDKITIQASAEDVLSIVNQIDSNQAKRILTQQQDNSFTISFIEIEYKKQPEELKHIKYKIEVVDNTNVFGMSPGEYILKIKLNAKGNKTNVKWILEYEVGNRGTLTEAEKGAKKQAVRNLLSKGLENLKSLAEK
jgi:hypothetical protein